MGAHKSNPLAFGTSIPPVLTVKDRFGRPLTPGDAVIVAMPPPPSGYIYEVVDLIPNLDPRAQPNTGTLRLVATLNLVVPLTGVLVQELLLVRSRAELTAQAAEDVAARRNGDGPIAITDPDAPTDPPAES